MILVAGGDSFTFGAELKDQINGMPSMSSCPAILAKQHNLEYQCVAQSGNSNDAIVRFVIAECEKQLQKQSNFGVVVMWTFTNRYEFRFNYNTGHKLTPWYTINAWSTLDDINKIENEFHTKDEHILLEQKKDLQIASQTGIKDFAKTFYKHVGDSEYYELWSSLKEILFLQLYLEQKNIPYLFLPADNTFYQHPNYIRQHDEYLESLYNQIDWQKWFFFEPGFKFSETKEPRGFYQWAIENKYPIGTTHPLEQAHTAAANLIKDKFNELVTKPLEQNKVRN